MTYILIFIFAGAFSAPLVYRYFSKISGWILAIFPLSAFIFLVLNIGIISNGGHFTEEFLWFESLNVNILFYVDGLSLLFGMIITLFGALISIYSNEYMKSYQGVGKFYLWLIFFAASMFGVVISGNLITLFIFWELTSFSSYFLIGFFNEKEKSRYAAMQAFLVTGIGGLALLAGFIFIYLITGSFDIRYLILHSDTIKASPLYNVALVLILIGAFTKSAQAPFHFWLPNAMEAPAPVSAYLHSATMVKAGVFLLMRLTPVLGDKDIWNITLISFGMVTMLLGAVMSVGQKDLKKILAYTTISALGTLVLLIGIGTPLAYSAAVLFVLSHALYKGPLFLIAGIIDKKTASRDVLDLSALYHYMPAVAVFSFLAALSFSGFPPFINFISKELSYKASIDTNYYFILIPVFMLVSNILSMYSAFMAGIKPFLGIKEEFKPKYKVGFSFIFAPAILSLGSIATVFFTGILDKNLISPAAESIFLVDTAVEIKYWYGFNAAFILSLLTFSGGYLLYKYRDIFKFYNIVFISKAAPSKIYDYMLSSIKFISYWQTRILQSGYLRYYIIIIIAFLSVIISAVIIQGNIINLTLDFRLEGIYEIVLFAGLMISAILSTISKSRLSAVVFLGVVGYGIAVIFVLHGAPDLAITQFTIETLTVIIFVLILYRLPKFSNISDRKSKTRDWIIASVFGIIMSIITLAVVSTDMKPEVANYYAEFSKILANGKNVVNVILVDFRALDTLGEITVIAIASLGIYGLLKLKVKK